MPETVYTPITKWTLVFTLALVGAATARSATVDVATPGNLLANLPSTNLNASSIAGFPGAATANAVDNQVGTSLPVSTREDNGQIFATGDPDQRLAITGFNSVLADIRIFSTPHDLTLPNEDIRQLRTITIYYSTASLTSLNSADFTGLLLPTTSLSPASFTGVIPGTDVQYLDLLVNAPTGTQSLLFDFGSAVDPTNNPTGYGDRVSEIQAFATPVPLPNAALAGLVLLGAAGFSKNHRRAMKSA